MGTVWADWIWFKGEDNTYTTCEVNFPPANVTAEVSLHGVSGDGTVYAGIKHYRVRLSSGEDEDHDLGEVPSWPPFVAGYLSSVTFALAAGNHQVGWLLGRIDFRE